MSKPLISVGQLIDQSWDRYREHLGAFLSISSWLLILAIVNTVALLLFPDATTLLLGERIDTAQGIGVILYAVSSFILAPLLNIFVLVSIVRLVRSILSSRGASAKRAVQEMKKRFWPTLVTSVMYVVILLLAILIALLPSGILSLLSLWFDSSLLLSAANLFLILGIFGALFFVLRWAVQFYFAPYLSAQDDLKSKRAMLESRLLTHKRYWSVFLRLLAPKVVFILFGILIIWVLNTILLVAFSGISGLDLDLTVRLSSFTQHVTPILATVFIQPLIILSDMLLIKDLQTSDV
jgi:hypothetical protein